MENELLKQPCVYGPPPWFEEEIIRNQTKPTLAKRIFIGIDLFVVTLMLLLSPKLLWVLLPIVYYVIYLRANVSLMMLRNERRTIIASLVAPIVMVFILLCSLWLSPNYDYFNWQLDMMQDGLNRYLENRTLAAMVFEYSSLWFLFVPLIYSLGRLFNKKNNHEAKRRDMFLPIYFMRTPWKKEITIIFLLSIVFVVAEHIGLRGETILGSMWMIPLSLTGL